MDGPLFLQITVKDLAFKAFSGNSDEIIVEFTVGKTRNLFSWPFVDLMVQCNYEDFDEILLRIKTKTKVIGVCEVKVYKEEESFQRDCVLFVEKDGIKQKTVAGTVRVEINQKKMQVFLEGEGEGEFFKFNSEEFAEILKYFNQEHESIMTEGSKPGFDLEINRGSEALQRKFKKVKYLLTGVNGKLKVLDVLRENWHRLQIELKQKDREIKSLQLKLQENLELYSENKDQYQNQIAVQSTKIAEQLQEIDRLNQVIKDLSSQNLAQKTEIDFLKADHARSHDQERLIKDTDKLVKVLQNTIEHNETISKNHTQESQALQKSYDQILKEHQETINSLTNENFILSKSVQTLSDSLNNYKNESESLKSQVINLECSLKEIETLEILIKSLEDKSTEYENSSKLFKQESLNLKERMDHTQKRFSDVTKEFQKEKLHIHKTAKKLTTDVTDLKNQLERKGIDGLNAQAELLHYKTGILLERDFKLVEAVANRSVSEISSVFLKYQSFETEYKLQTDFLLNSYLSLTQRHLVVQRNLSRIISLLRDKEREIPLLREMIAELKSREIYVPVSGDIIDNYLANYINSRTEKLEVPFVRLYHGMYLFGSKKVSMKIENSGLVSIF